MSKLKVATIWLGGCSGCHMSFLDVDEWLFDLAEHVDVVYGPLVDTKIYPDHVDVCLVEGAIASEEHLHQIKQIRRNTDVLISFGDCAVTGNVTALRNPLGSVRSVLQQVYENASAHQAQLPLEPGIVPVLLDQVRPVHAVVPVEIYLPGCPPPAARIRAALEQLLSGAPLQLAGRSMLKFG